MSSSVEIQIRDAGGKAKGSREVSASILGARINPGVMHQVVRWQRARKRAGTHAVQTRAEMTGGGAKPWKQKGTGRARAGSNTSPLWVGGGIAHGPKVRDYDFTINKKEKKAALCTALSAAHKEEQLFILENFGLKEVSTKSAVALLKKLGVELKKRALIVLDASEETEAKSLRNIDGVTIVLPHGLNAYDILNSSAVIFSSKAFDQAEKRLG